uniref:Lipolysis-activating peptide 1-alpha chain n=1 Tax=Centruroides hentzi TaxID=88313 RepID=A0A2I9LP54_9SCOR
MNFRLICFLMITICLIGTIVAFENDVRPRDQYGKEIFCPRQGFDQKCNAICQRSGYQHGFCDQRNCMCKVHSYTH